MRCDSATHTLMTTAAVTIMTLSHPQTAAKSKAWKSYKVFSTITLLYCSHTSVLSSWSLRISATAFFYVELFLLATVTSTHLFQMDRDKSKPWSSNKDCSLESRKHVGGIPPRVKTSNMLASIKNKWDKNGKIMLIIFILFFDDQPTKFKPKNDQVTISTDCICLYSLNIQINRLKSYNYLI